MISSEKCPVCGKRGKRPCPATGGLICPACCGSHRGSKLNCPPECSFYPLGTAGHEVWVEIDRAWLIKTLDYLDEHLGTKTMGELLQESTTALGLEGNEKSVAAYFPTVYAGLLAHRDAEGRTAADRWESQGWAGLNNDEKVLMQYRRQSFVTVIEIERTLDPQSVQALDVLEPDSKPFLIFDHTRTISSIPRFTKLLVWLTRYPHFSRMSAAGFDIPDMIWAPWLRIMEAWLAEEQKTRPELKLKEVLTENLARCSHVIAALQHEVRQRILQSMDLHHCVAIYTFNGPLEEIKAILDSKPDFAPEEPRPAQGFETPTFSYAWLRKGESKEIEKSMPASFQSNEEEDGSIGLLGNLRLYPDRLLIETTSKLKYDFARKMMDKYFGASVQFQSESVVDLARQIAERDAIWPEASQSRDSQAEARTEQDQIPPEIRRQLLHDAHNKHYQKLLDQPVPMLENLSPRSAAQTSALRPKLIKLFKGHLHHLDIINRRDGLDLNIDWVLDELQLSELK